MTIATEMYCHLLARFCTDTLLPSRCLSFATVNWNNHCHARILAKVGCSDCAFHSLLELFIHVDRLRRDLCTNNTLMIISNFYCQPLQSIKNYILGKRIFQRLKSMGYGCVNLVSDKPSATMKCTFICNKMHQCMQQDSISLCCRSAAVWGHQSLHAQGTGWAGVATGRARHRFPDRRRWARFSFMALFLNGNINQAARFTCHVVSVVLRREDAWWRERLVPC